MNQAVLQTDRVSPSGTARLRDVAASQVLKVLEDPERAARSRTLIALLAGGITRMPTPPETPPDHIRQTILDVLHVERTLSDPSYWEKHDRQGLEILAHVRHALRGEQRVPKKKGETILAAAGGFVPDNMDQHQRGLRQGLEHAADVLTSYFDQRDGRR